MTITDMRDTGASARRAARHVTLFLDVDGVLNSYPVTGLRFLREGRRKVRAWHYELHFRPRVVRFLDRLTRRRLVDIVWLSTWSQRCRTEIEPKLGFRSSFAVIPMPDDTYNRFANDPHEWWKARAVEEWFAAHEEGRAIWIDDDLTAPETRAHFEQKYGSRLLMIAPEFSQGLSEDHFSLIRDFTYRRAVPAPARRTLLTTEPTGELAAVQVPAPGLTSTDSLAGDNDAVSNDFPTGIGTTYHGKA